MRISVRDFLRRLSADAIVTAFKHFQLPAVELAGLKPRAQVNAAEQRFITGTETARAGFEAMAGHILSLTDRTDLAERALRSVCYDRPDLLELLDDDSSLEERLLSVRLSDQSVLDKARNVMIAFRWRDGRYHRAFTVSEPRMMSDDLELVHKEIRAIVRATQGGRRVHVETFQYPDPGPSEVAAGSPSLIHHIAVYLESPANYLVQFGEGEPPVSSMLHRGAREVAIDYDPATGRLDVAGKGVGGSIALEKIAEAFRVHALAEASMTKLERAEWDFDIFRRREPPDLVPPDGYSSIYVTGLVLRSSQMEGATAAFTAEPEHSAYDRIRELGVDARRLGDDLVSEVSLSLCKVSESEEEPERSVRVNLKWPGAVAFEGATERERKEIMAWLDGQPFAKRTR